MPICKKCGLEHSEEELDTCDDCGETFCVECGDMSKHLCNGCLEEDLDTEEDQAETDWDEGVEKEMEGEN